MLRVRFQFTLKSAVENFSIQWNFIFNHVFLVTMNMENSGWPFLGEQLICKCEIDNVTDRYAVTVKKYNGKTVGHVQKKILITCSMFLQHGFVITATVTGHQIGWNIRHLRDFESRVCIN